jgi:hypothetical protein
VNPDATAALTAQPYGLHRVEVRGAFSHPHWLAFLCAGLSARGVSVVSGSATKHGPMQWEAQFTVEGPVDGVDVLALAAMRPVTRDPAAPVLREYVLTRRADAQLELRIEAPDSLGFLGRLLSRISLLTLLPSEVEIATVNGAISDRFVLGGIGTAAPSEQVLVSLKEMLEPMLAG